MNAKNLKSTIGSTLAVAVALGMLASLPAQAGSGTIKITHADTPYRGAVQPVASTATKVQSKASQARAEIQVAVMPNAPSQPAARRSVFIHR
jgi:hypothetical protein